MELFTPRRSGLLKSRLSSSLFQNFVSSYQSLSKNEPNQNSFVFVSPDGSVKYLTNLMNDFEGKESFFALSVAGDGWMEFLTLQE